MPANRLYNILTFTNVGAGATTAQLHLLNVNEVNKIPDFIWGNNSNFTLAANATQVTVTNNGLGPETIEVWCCYLYSVLRVFGGSGTTSLTPDPYILVGGGGASGTSSGNPQRFVYTCSGAEGSDFNVLLPLARANDIYLVFPALDGVAASANAAYALDCPDLLVGDRTTTQFRVRTTASVEQGDQLAFIAIDPT